MKEKRLAIIELALATALFVGAVFCIKATFQGSLIAVVLGSCAALVSALLFDDGDRRYTAAKDKGHGNR
jgi:hypothetical protein